MLNLLWKSGGLRVIRLHNVPDPRGKLHTPKPDHIIHNLTHEVNGLPTTNLLTNTQEEDATSVVLRKGVVVDFEDPDSVANLSLSTHAAELMSF